LTDCIGSAALTSRRSARSVAPTGRSRVIDGIKCDEYSFATTMTMGEMSGPQMPPGAAEMLKDLSIVVKGSMWVAKDLPGAAEYIAFQKALAKSELPAAVGRMSGVSIPGMDKMTQVMASVDGVGYMTVMDLTIVGGTGQIADMMRQMGAMRITTKVTSVSADPLSDDLFKVPEGYTIK